MKKIACLAAAMIALSGCWGSCEVTDPWPDFEDPSRIPPSVDEIVVPDYPPLGPGGVVRARVSDDCCLSQVQLSFANAVSVPVSGEDDEIEVSAMELGEGMGTLYVDAFDTDGLWASREVQRLVVDLSPPVAEIGDTVLKADGDALDIWVGDAWVLGSVSLTFQGVTQTRTFPAAYPATIGEEWDHSLERFPTSELPSGSGMAELTVVDAAGNRMTEVFPLVIDGERPLANIVSPAAGASVSGMFEVSLRATDAEGEASISLYAGGALYATALGPEASIVIDASSFVPGPLELTAVAVDAAGNESMPFTVSVEVE